MCDRDRSPRRQRGQGLVEFALVFPIIALIFFGIFDFGRAVYAYSTISNAARSAARVAIVNQTITGGTTCDPTNLGNQSIDACAVQSGVALGLTASDVSVTFRDSTDTTACGTPYQIGCLAEVTVTYQFTPITPVIGNVIGTISMSSTSKLPIEAVYP